MSEQNDQPANRQLTIATLAAAIIQARGGAADQNQVVEALRDAEAALRLFGQERREGRRRRGIDIPPSGYIPPSG